MKYQLYKITNNINGKSYIGQTKDSIGYLNRFKQHIYSATKSKNDYERNFLIHKAIRKYGAENFSVKLLLHNIDENKIDFYEQLWVHKFNTLGCGYNLTSGGQGVHNYVVSDENRLKSSISMKKYWSDLKANNPQEYKRLCEIRRNTHLGKSRPDSVKKVLSEFAKTRTGSKNPFYGRKHSSKTKSLISSANSIPIEMLSLDDEVLMSFKSITEAESYLVKKGFTTNKNCSARIIVICKGGGKTAYGFKWRYIESSVSTNGDECNHEGGDVTVQSAPQQKC